MVDLIQLNFGDGEIVRCTSLADAKSKAIARSESRVIVEVFSDGRGGPMTTLELDQTSRDWISVDDEPR